MVTRKRLRSFFTALGLYAVAALFIGYFAANAFSGNHGLRAKQQLDEQVGELTPNLMARRLSGRSGSGASRLLRADRLDPDLLDERARAELHYIHPREVILTLKPR